MKKLALLLPVLLLMACAGPRLYWYGDSSWRYYRAVKKQDPYSLEAYKSSLERVFEYNFDQGNKVPPGLYCDYAMLLLNEGNSPGARIYLLKEKEAWPESAALIDHLLARYELEP
jgi:hypothetical protein